MLVAALLLGVSFDDVWRKAAANAAAMIAMEGNADSANTAVLDCETSAPEDDASLPKHFYRVPPTDPRQFTRDAIEGGIMPLLYQPERRWLVDYEKRTIGTPGRGAMALEINYLSGSTVVASNRDPQPPIQLALNRLTGEATLLVSADVTAWNAKFGTTVAPYRVWHLKCRRLQKLF